MNISRKFNPKLVASFTALAMLLIVTFPAIGNYNKKKFFCNTLTASPDTIPLPRHARASPQTDSTNPVRNPKSPSSPAHTGADTVRNANDTVPVTRTDTLNVKVSKDSLDAPIEYSASDSVVLEVPTKKIILYNKANVKQKDMDLSAFRIELDQPKKGGDRNLFTGHCW